MIDYFYNYIKNIILFLIFMSFIQVILPNNKYRSYINLVFGMMLVLVMIKPLNFIFQNIKAVQALAIFNEEDINLNNNINVDKYKNVQNQMFKTAFEQNVKNQIENMLQNKYIIKNIQIQFYESDYEQIMIDTITLYLIENNKSVYVKPFNENNNKNEKEVEDIKRLIAKNYEINLNNIFITIN